VEIRDGVLLETTSIGTDHYSLREMVGLRRDLPDYGTSGVTALEIDVVEQHPDPHSTIHCPHLTLGEDVPGRVRLPDVVPEFQHLFRPDP
jgi:hypothetical protein